MFFSTFIFATGARIKQQMYICIGQRVCWGIYIRYWVNWIGFGICPSRELVWHISTQVNNGLLAVYITVFDPRRCKRRRSIPFLVYAPVYPSISSNLVNLDTLSSNSYSVCTHTCSPFSRKPLMRWPRTAKNGLITNY